MDDGFQNPTLFHDYSILLQGLENHFGNGKVFPAGPLREPADAARVRAHRVVNIVAANSEIKASTEDCSAWLEPVGGDTPERVFAFCGIANPERFFRSLEQQGAAVLGKATFPDHHGFTNREVSALRSQAQKLNAQLITTEKDFVRIDPVQRDDIAVLSVEMSISSSEKLVAEILSIVAERKAAS
jgi:tetraacyldisaccharide 4'-kinase